MLTIIAFILCTTAAACLIGTARAVVAWWKLEIMGEPLDKPVHSGAEFTKHLRAVHAHYGY